MSFTVAADRLALLVDRMKPLQAGGAPWAVHMVWADDEVFMEAAAFNVGAYAAVPAEVDEIGAVNLPLTKLAAWLDHVEGEIRVEAGEAGLTFLSDEADLPVFYYGEEIGGLPDEPGDHMALDPGVWHAISRVAFASDHMPVDKAPDWRHMIHLGKGVVWAGSDLSAIASVEVPLNEHTVSIYPEVAKLVKLLGDGIRTKVDATKRLHISDSVGKYVVPTFRGSVPNVPSLVLDPICGDRRPKAKVTVPRKDLLDALTAIRAVQVSDSFRLTVALEDEGLRLEVETGNGPATRFVAADHDSPGTLTCTRLGSFRGMVAGSKSTEVTVYLGDDRTPQVVIEDDYVALCSPIVSQALARPKNRTRKAA
jgi:hypothetical protein